MGDRLAFWKYLRLGDFIKGPPELEVVYESCEFTRSGWDTNAVIKEVAGGAGFHAIVQAAFYKDHDSVGSETHREYMGRKLDFITSLRTILGMESGYEVLGDLSIIENQTNDATAITNNETAGSNVTVEVDADISCAVGDYVLLVDASVTQYEVTEVENVDTGPPVAYVLDLTKSWTAGDSIYRLEWYLQDAFAVEVPKITGHDANSQYASSELEFVFGGVVAPTHNL